MPLYDSNIFTQPPVNGHLGSSFGLFCSCMWWSYDHLPIYFSCAFLSPPAVPFLSLHSHIYSLLCHLACNSAWFPWACRRTVSSIAQPDWWPCSSRRCPTVSLRRTWWAGPCPTWLRPCRHLGRLCTVMTSLAMRMSCPSGWSPAPGPTPRSSECSKYTQRGGYWDHPARHWRCIPLGWSTGQNGAHLKTTV